MVQCPELWTLGAISLASKAPSTENNSSARTPTYDRRSSKRRQYSIASAATSGVTFGAGDVDFRETGRRNVEGLKDLLLQQPVLRCFQRFQRGKDFHSLADELHRRKRYALELVSDYIDAVEKAFQRVRVPIIGRDQRPDLSHWGAGVWIEKLELNSQLVAGEREHSSELPAPEYPDFHSAAAGSG